MMPPCGAGRKPRRKDSGDGVGAFISLLFKPGDAYQFDWSHEDVEIAGKLMRVKVAQIRLRASRAVYSGPIRVRHRRWYSTHMRAASPSSAGCCCAVSTIT
jgi:hypothetical protein